LKQMATDVVEHLQDFLYQLQRLYATKPRAVEETVEYGGFLKCESLLATAPPRFLPFIFGSVPIWMCPTVPVQFPHFGSQSFPASYGVCLCESRQLLHPNIA